MTFHDDGVLALISHATEERLKCLIDELKSVTQQRTTLSLQVNSRRFSCTEKYQCYAGLHSPLTNR
jgi:hypothetical protein